MALTCFDPLVLRSSGRFDVIQAARVQPIDAFRDHSACCSIDATTFERTPGLPGPVIMKRFGKPAVISDRDTYAVRLPTAA